MKITANQKSSAIFFVGNFTLSVFRYVFHLLLLRLLLPEQYGEFLTFLSLIYILSVPTSTIATVTTKTVSSLFGKKDFSSINSFFYFLFQKVFYPMSLLGLLVIIFSSWLATVFKANQVSFVVLGFSTVISSIQTIVGAYLLGLHLLTKHTLFGVLTVIFTICLAVSLISLNMGSLGAVIGQVGGGLLATALAYLWLRKYISPAILTKKRYNLGLKSLTSFSFLNSLATISLISTDILLARILLDPHQSGIYSSLSVIGRIVIFGLSPLSTLMLTFSAKKHASGDNTFGLFRKMGLIIFGLGVLAAVAFNMAPNIIVKIFGGSNFSESGQYLGLFALSMVFYSWSQFLLAFFNGTGKEKYNLVIAIFALIQPLSLALWGRSLQSLTLISFWLQLILFIILFSLLLKPLLSGAKINHGQS